MMGYLTLIMDMGYLTLIMDHVNGCVGRGTT